MSTPMRMIPLATCLSLTACGTPPLAGPPDLAAPSDALPNSDLTVNRDLPSPVDLATTPDIATNPDIASNPDLARPPDLASTDGGSSFEDQIAGIWLIGWSGGLEHYSWVRFMRGGRLDVLPPMGNVAWTPFWMGCSGAGQWTLAARPQTVQLAMPMGCAPQSEVLTFTMFGPAGGWPGETRSASIEQNPPKGALGGHQFGPGQCDVQFTMCKLPF